MIFRLKRSSQTPCCGYILISSYSHFQGDPCTRFCSSFCSSLCCHRWPTPHQAPSDAANYSTFAPVRCLPTRWWCPMLLARSLRSARLLRLSSRMASRRLIATGLPGLVDVHTHLTGDPASHGYSRSGLRHLQRRLHSSGRREGRNAAGVHRKGKEDRASPA